MHRTAAAAAALTAGGVAVRRAFARRAADDWPEIDSADPDVRRWQVVTVHRPREEVLVDGRLPEPLARLGDGVEVRVRPAPGDRGTELAARLRGDGNRLTGMAAHVTGDDPRLVVRESLRQSKQLAETGELLRPDRPAAGRRAGLNRPLDRPPDYSLDRPLDRPVTGRRAAPDRPLDYSRDRRPDHPSTGHRAAPDRPLDQPLENPLEGPPEPVVERSPDGEGTR